VALISMLAAKHSNINNHHGTVQIVCTNLRLLQSSTPKKVVMGFLSAPILV
jgi:hypothetical protein